MDILDIDEALKDDSFIFLSDKTHDDVSNILQRWKINNCGLSSAVQPQKQHDQAYKFNSKTFTRPKRKTAQNLESNLQTNDTQQNNHFVGPTALNLEIGGLVTNMQKSFLQDTSPPSSICSSMGQSIDHMNNSLISSADFTNLNFLQSTQSLDFKNDLSQTGGIGGFNITEKSSADDYTLSDMIRDRKTLESLTLSGDGTLIKDSHIAQIDDFSMALSKTASDCSTMDNSTESMTGSNNRFPEHRKLSLDSSTTTVINNAVGSQDATMPMLMQRTMVLSDEMIGDTTFNLVATSLHDSLNMTHEINIVPELKQINEQQTKVNQTFGRASAIDETMLKNSSNTTFECQQQLLPDERCETPESVEKKLSVFCISTPLTSLRHRNYKKNNNKQQLKIVEDFHISPIIASKSVTNATRIMLNNTFESAASAMASPLPQTEFEPTVAFIAAKEMLETITNPNLKKFDTNAEQLEGTVKTEAVAPAIDDVNTDDSRKQMQNVMDLAEAEVELLAQQDDEEQFDNMLDELGKVEMKPQQLKMQKSLESIKKRFNYSPYNAGGSAGAVVEEHARSQEAEDMHELMEHMNAIMGEVPHQSNFNKTIELKEYSSTLTRQDELKYSKDYSISSNSGMTSSLMSSQGSERLLSRRSRLYDDVNLSILSSISSGNSSYSNLQSAKNNSASFVMHCDVEVEEHPKDVEDKQQQPPEIANEMQQEEKEKFQVSHPAECETEETNATTDYKLADKRQRQRDRERFKTIKITKPRPNNDTSKAKEITVPCIDNDNDIYDQVGGDDVVENEAFDQQLPQQQYQQRFSRRDHSSPSPPVFNNNKNEQEQVKTRPETTLLNNYLTFKKPKDKINTKCNLPEIQATEANVVVSGTARAEVRSLSRPRYISGLQKLSSVNKATSAGDLQKTSTINSGRQSMVGAVMLGKAIYNDYSPKNATDVASSDLKSPMGIKSKSFHNLSSNYGTGRGIARPSSGYGPKKPVTAVGYDSTDKQKKLTSARLTSTSQNDDAVFKEPKLMSGLSPQQITPSIGSCVATAGFKRAGLARPSSGYYSLNVIPKTSTGAAKEFDIASDQPTGSLSSASSRGSLFGGTTMLKQPFSNTTANAIDALSPKLTQITTGPSGIPKPSGLRPPSNIKRSGLPRPSSFVRR